MKFLAVLSAILAVACASNTWTLQMLSEATTSPYTDPALMPYLEAALNDMMHAMWNGQTVEPVTVTMSTAGASTSMTLNELSEAIADPNTDPALLPALEAALNEMMHALWNGEPVEAAVIAAPAMEIHYYTLNELSVLLQDPATNPELIPYYEHALNEMMTALFAGHDMTAIVIAVPAGVATVEATPADNEAPVVPVVPETVVEAPAAAPANPLVQIIVNINQQQEVVNVPASPAVVPADPINVVDISPAMIDPAIVVEAAPIIADPISVVEQAPEAAEPIIVAEPIFG